MKYLSVCSGIEAATVAWHPLGWKPVGFCEIDPFPSAVLAHHYPKVPNYGDFTKLADPAHPVHIFGADLLVGGTPCQAFSIAGLRQGLADPRGGLTLEFLKLARTLRPRWVVWENVPGVLSQDGGRAFGAFLGGLVDIGYGWAYRVLDAQYVRVDGYPGAVPQRRRRVFVVAHTGGAWQRAATVLSEPESVRGHTTPRRAKGENAAAVTAARTDGEAVIGRDGVSGCYWDGGQVTQTLDAVLYKGQTMPEKNRFPAVIQSTYTAPAIGTFVASDVAGTLVKHSGAGTGETQNPAFVQSGLAVRRLTPVECERLQGFPDNYTRVPWRGKPAAECPDGGRYKALGNSMACNVMRWIGQRIKLVEEACHEQG